MGLLLLEIHQERFMIWGLGEGQDEPENAVPNVTPHLPRKVMMFFSG